MAHDPTTLDLLREYVEVSRATNTSLTEINARLKALEKANESSGEVWDWFKTQPWFSWVVMAILLVALARLGLLTPGQTTALENLIPHAPEEDHAPISP